MAYLLKSTTLSIFWIDLISSYPWFYHIWLWFSSWLQNHYMRLSHYIVLWVESARPSTYSHSQSPFVCFGMLCILPALNLVISSFITSLKIFQWLCSGLYLYFFGIIPTQVLMKESILYRPWLLRKLIHIFI